jgi:hypothetical protein
MLRYELSTRIQTTPALSRPISRIPAVSPEMDYPAVGPEMDYRAVGSGGLKACREERC